MLECVRCRLTFRKCFFFTFANHLMGDKNPDSYVTTPISGLPTNVNPIFIFQYSPFGSVFV